MKKRLLSTLLTICLIITFSYEASASSPSFSQEISVILPEYDITLNGTKFDNANAEYPFVVYKDITYLPLTWNITRHIGMKLSFFSFQESARVYSAYAVFVGEGENCESNLTPDISDTPNEKALTAKVCNDAVLVQAYYPNSENEYPLLHINDIYYMPLTWTYAFERLGWDYSFDSERGLVINTANNVRPVLSDDDIKSYLVRNMTAHMKPCYYYSYDFYYGHKGQSTGIGNLFVCDNYGNHYELDFSENEKLKSLGITRFEEYADSYDYTATFENGVLSVNIYHFDENKKSIYARISVNMLSGELLAYEKIA